jgi:Glyoxalase/Bleomycin resistance protein/Dioxygenase superfamily
MSPSLSDPIRSPALDLGPIRQFGYVVLDMDAALHHWTTVLGVGPFYLIERVALDWFRHRDSTTAPDLCIALANSGPLQIELICQRDETPSMFREFLAAGPEGLQHTAWWSTRYRADHDRLVGAGHEPTQEGQIGGPQGCFAYFADGGPRGTVLELSDVSGAKGEFFAHIAEASEGWDGSRPIRRVS